MKKKILFLMSLLAALTIGLIGYKAEPVSAANQYGIAKKFTTPKATRGVWYYHEKGSEKIEKLKITKHTAAGYKLYVPSQKFFKKNVYQASVKKRNAFIKKVMKKNIYAGFLYKKGFNVNNWVSVAGDGIYYLPVAKMVAGKKVKALRVATGAGPYTAYYAYKTKKLANVDLK